MCSGGDLPDQPFRNELQHAAVQRLSELALIGGKAGLAGFRAQQVGQIGDEVRLEFSVEEGGHAVQVGRIDLDILGAGDGEYGRLDLWQVCGRVVGHEFPEPPGI